MSIVKKYDSLQMVIDALKAEADINSSHVLLEQVVKFVTPDSNTTWENKLKKCLFIVDILWGIADNAQRESGFYSFEVLQPTFHRESTLSVAYNSNLFKFTIKLGSDIGKYVKHDGKMYELKGISRAYHIAYGFEGRFFYLIEQMVKSFPIGRCREIVKSLQVPRNRFGLNLQY